MKRILLLGLFICNLLGLETIAQNITGSIITNKMKNFLTQPLPSLSDKTTN